MVAIKNAVGLVGGGRTVECRAFCRSLNGLDLLPPTQQYDDQRRHPILHLRKSGSSPHNCDCRAVADKTEQDRDT